MNDYSGVGECDRKDQTLLKYALNMSNTLSRIILSKKVFKSDSWDTLIG